MSADKAIEHESCDHESLGAAKKRMSELRQRKTQGSSTEADSREWFDLLGKIRAEEAKLPQSERSIGVIRDHAKR